VKFRIPDLMQVAAHIVAQIREHKPDAVFLDATGIGYGVYDRLQQLNCQKRYCRELRRQARPARGVHRRPTKYANKRAEMWGFLKTGAASAVCPMTGN
jgi:hypothetical protein